MGDSVAIVAFRGVPDCEQALSRAETVLRTEGIVEGAYEPDAALAGKPGERVLRPGPRAADATRYGQRLRELKTNGVRFVGPRYLHGWAIGFADWFACPACAARTGPDQGEVFADLMGRVGQAAWDWSQGSSDGSVSCPSCGAASDVEAWLISDPVFLADIAVEFWNWPFIDPDPVRRAEWWNIDILGLLERAVGGPAKMSGHKI